MMRRSTGLSLIVLLLLGSACTVPELTEPAVPSEAVEDAALGTAASALDVPPLPTQSVHATTVAVGGAHACALLPDRRVACWGSNSYGQIGAARSVGSSAYARIVEGLLGPVRSLAAGGAHTCAVVEPDGVVQCWGSNAWRQIGGGSLEYWVPVTVAGLTQVTSLSLGSHHSCIVSGGRVRCFGVQWDNRLGNSPGWIPSVARYGPASFSNS
jgi:alpha-tubulin suppressor-like RCC1 family protein